MKKLALSLVAVTGLFLAFGHTLRAANVVDTGAAVPTTFFDGSEEEPVETPEEEVPGSGTIEACGDAPGGDPSVEIKKGGTAPGNIKVTSVTVNGVTIPPSQYTVNDQNTTSPEVVFHNPTPGAPAKGAKVCVYGTTKDGDKEHEGKLDW